MTSNLSTNVSPLSSNSGAPLTLNNDDEDYYDTPHSNNNNNGNARINGGNKSKASNTSNRTKTPQYPNNSQPRNAHTASKQNPKITTLETKVNTTMSQMMSRISSLTSENSTLTDDIDDLEGLVTKLETKLKDNVVESDGVIGGLQDVNDNLTDEVSNLKNTIADISGKIVELERRSEKDLLDNEDLVVINGELTVEIEGFKMVVEEMKGADVRRGEVESEMSGKNEALKHEVARLESLIVTKADEKEKQTKEQSDITKRFETEVSRLETYSESLVGKYNLLEIKHAMQDDDLNVKIISIEEEKVFISSENDALKGKTFVLDKEVERLNAMIDAMVNENRDNADVLQTENTRLETILVDANVEIAALTDDKHKATSDSEREVERLEATITEMNAMIDAMYEERQKEDNENNDKTEVLQKEVNRLEGAESLRSNEVNESIKKSESLEKEVTRLAVFVDKMKVNISDVENLRVKDLNSFEVKSGDLNNEVKRLEGVIEELSINAANTDEKDNLIATLQTQSHTLQNKLDTKDLKIDELEGRRKTVSDRIKELEDDIVVTASRKSKDTKRIEMLENENNVVLGKLMGDVKFKDERVAELDGVIESLRLELESQQQQNTAITANEISELQTINANLTLQSAADKADMTKRLNDSDNDNIVMRHDLKAWIRREVELMEIVGELQAALLSKESENRKEGGDDDVLSSSDFGKLKSKYQELETTNRNLNRGFYSREQALQSTISSLEAKIAEAANGSGSDGGGGGGAKFGRDKEDFVEHLRRIAQDVCDLMVHVESSSSPSPSDDAIDPASPSAPTVLERSHEEEEDEEDEEGETTTTSLIESLDARAPTVLEGFDEGDEEDEEEEEVNIEETPLRRSLDDSFEASIITQTPAVHGISDEELVNDSEDDEIEGKVLLVPERRLSVEILITTDEELDSDDLRYEKAAQNSPLRISRSIDKGELKLGSSRYGV